MPDPAAMLQALLRAQAGTGPGVGGRPLQTVTAPQQTPPPEPPGGGAAASEDEAAEGQQPSDEEMLETVSNAMGQQGRGGGAPPPMSGMKWVDVDADRQALLANPDPENIDAFVEYWGADELPPELAGQAAGAQGQDQSSY